MVVYEGSRTLRVFRVLNAVPVANCVLAFYSILLDFYYNPPSSSNLVVISIMINIDTPADQHFMEALNKSVMNIWDTFHVNVYILPYIDVCNTYIVTHA